MITFAVPIGYSLRAAPPKSVKEEYRTLVSANMQGLVGSPTRYYTIEFNYYGTWLTKNGKVRKRDAHNYASVLADIVCDCLQIDDSQFFEFIVRKIHVPDATEEYVVVNVY